MDAARETPRLSPLARFGFIALMIGLTVLFVVLGTWQVQRLAEKEALIATVEARLHDAPVAFPQASLWTGLDADDLDYRRYALGGHFDHDQTVLIFTSLTAPAGRYGGVGYWVMVPFMPEGGGTVWVNRGFVPDTMAAAYADGGDGPDGLVEIEGIARRAERAGTFTPTADFEARREWVRDPERLAAFLPQGAGAVAPVTIDLAAGAQEDLPQGGETAVDFPNRHLEYAGTWFLFAVTTPVMLGFWLWRQRKSRNLAHRDKAN